MLWLIALLICGYSQERVEKLRRRVRLMLVEVTKQEASLLGILCWEEAR